MNIPIEIVDHISTYITDRSHQASVALINKAWNSSMTPMLYRDIDISEASYSRARFRETGELPQMYGVTRTLAKYAIPQTKNLLFPSPKTAAFARKKKYKLKTAFKKSLSQLLSSFHSAWLPHQLPNRESPASEMGDNHYTHPTVSPGNTRPQRVSPCQQAGDVFAGC